MTSSTNVKPILSALSPVYARSMQRNSCVERFKAGFLFGASRGYGVGLVKNSFGQWRLPAFYKAGGGALPTNRCRTPRHDFCHHDEKGLDLLVAAEGSNSEANSPPQPTYSCYERTRLHPNADIYVYVHGTGHAVGAAVKVGTGAKTALQTKLTTATTHSQATHSLRPCPTPTSGHKLVKALQD